MLAFNAGMINVLGLITLLHQSISHMTGNVSMLAMSLVEWQPEHIIFLLLVIICYVCGSFYSGFILGSSHFRLGRRYGLPLSLVALFIFLCWLLLPYFPRYGLLWACTAMGLQNAMVSHYKGTIIRTTHLSGVLTDIGLALGYKARGLIVEKSTYCFTFTYSCWLPAGWNSCRFSTSIFETTIIFIASNFKLSLKYFLLDSLSL